MDFSGESIFVDANGKTIIKADDREQIVYVDYHLPEAQKVRKTRPYTSLRRTEIYV